MATVQVAAAALQYESLAAALPSTLRLGTSSWSFPGWHGLVWADRSKPTELSRHGLAAYGRHPLFRTVCVDSTFYAPVAPDRLAAYADQVPGDFHFVVKGARAVTSPFDESGRVNPQYLDARFAAHQVVAPFAEGMGAKGAVLLFQFPPQGGRITGQPRTFATALGEFLAALPRSVPYAVELRDAPLLTDDYREALRRGGAHHCLSAHPRLPPLSRQAEFAAGDDGPLVLRWMLHRRHGYRQAVQRYAPFGALVDEDPQTRAEVAALCLGASAAGREVLVIANNKAEGCAPLTLVRLAEAINGGQNSDAGGAT
ncbi:MAG: DUF72 domain-containing protein [Planctomycetota bacterium]